MVAPFSSFAGNAYQVFKHSACFARNGLWIHMNHKTCYLFRQISLFLDFFSRKHYSFEGSPTIPFPYQVYDAYSGGAGIFLPSSRREGKKQGVGLVLMADTWISLSQVEQRAPLRGIDVLQATCLSLQRFLETGENYSFEVADIPGEGYISADWKFSHVSLCLQDTEQLWFGNKGGKYRHCGNVGPTYSCSNPIPSLADAMSPAGHLQASWQTGPLLGFCAVYLWEQFP